MAEVKQTLHSKQPKGVCALGREEGEVYVMTIEDGTITKGPLCLKCRLMLEDMKLESGGNGDAPSPAPKKKGRKEQKTEVVAEVLPESNGTAS